MTPQRKKLVKILALLAGIAALATIILVSAGLHDDIGKADVGLVLGSKVELDGRPSPGLQARLDKALELWRAGWFPEVIVSGGLGREGYDEATVMAGYLVDHGIPKDHVILDHTGNTTFDSARNAAGILTDRKWTSVFVISQYFHIPRSRLAMKKAGAATIRSAHAEIFEWRDLYSCPRELAGYVNYWFRGYDSPGR